MGNSALSSLTPAQQKEFMSIKAIIDKGTNYKTLFKEEPKPTGVPSLPNTKIEIGNLNIPEISKASNSLQTIMFKSKNTKPFKKPEIK